MKAREFAASCASVPASDSWLLAVAVMSSLRVILALVGQEQEQASKAGCQAKTAMTFSQTGAHSSDDAFDDVNSLEEQSVSCT
jgi:hypothetical protein